MDLHSFAAKVMLLKNLHRRYMMNAPVPAMEELISKGLPDGSVFIATRERKKTLDDHKNMTVDEYKNLHMDELNKESQESLAKYIRTKSSSLRKAKKSLGELNGELDQLPADYQDGKITNEQYVSSLEEIKGEIEEEKYKHRIYKE